jgi:serine/threonine protein kinase
VKATSASAEENLGVALGAILVGKYRIDAILGQGGMGVVARATHLHLSETVAIKFLRADIAGDDEANQRFLREAHAAWKLKNEHVARVLDVGTLDIEFIVQACAGLAEAHALGIVHRDVKPAEPHPHLAPRRHAAASSCSTSASRRSRTTPTCR